MYAKLIESGMGSLDGMEPEGNCWGLGGSPTGECVIIGWSPREEKPKRMI